MLHFPAEQTDQGWLVQDTTYRRMEELLEITHASLHAFVGSLCDDALSTIVIAHQEHLPDYHVQLTYEMPTWWSSLVLLTSPMQGADHRHLIQRFIAEITRTRPLLKARTQQDGHMVAATILAEAREAFAEHLSDQWVLSTRQQWIESLSDIDLTPTWSMPPRRHPTAINAESTRRLLSKRSTAESVLTETAANMAAHLYHQPRTAAEAITLLLNRVPDIQAQEMLQRIDAQFWAHQAEWSTTLMNRLDQMRYRGVYGKNTPLVDLAPVRV